MVRPVLASFGKIFTTTKTQSSRRKTGDLTIFVFFVPLVVSAHIELWLFGERKLRRPLNVTSSLFVMDITAAALDKPSG